MCAMLHMEFPSLIHLSAGELLREEMASGSEVASLIDKYIKDGLIVPVNFLILLNHSLGQNYLWTFKKSNGEKRMGCKEFHLS